MAVKITAQPTPNPNAMKFNCSTRVVTSGTVTFNSRSSAEGTPWAHALFEVDGVSAVFAMNDFVTVSRREGANWDTLIDGVTLALQKHLK